MSETEQLTQEIREAVFTIDMDGVHYIDGSAPETAWPKVRSELLRLSAEVERLAASQQWQTIETAPHEQYVLLFCPHRHESNPQRIEVGPATWGERIGQRSNRGAHAWATHWMPLPKPPAERGEG